MADLTTHMGIGAHANARKATSVEAQLMPRLWYIGVTNSGNLFDQPGTTLAAEETTHATPKRERRTELAANTDAAYRRYESMR